MALKLIKLTEEQEKCVQFTPKGELLIRGIPGAGKTTILLERANYLNTIESNEGDRNVLFLTFNRALSTYLRQLAKKATTQTPVEALTFHTWGAQILKEIGALNTRNIAGKEQEEMIAYAKRTVAKYGDPTFPNIKAKTPKVMEYQLIKFLKEEVSWIKNNNMNERGKYLNCVRTGRGNQVQVTKLHRESIFDVYEKYQSILTSKNAHDFDDIALLLLIHEREIPVDRRPLHVLIDEAQDLSPAQLKVVKLLAVKSLTIAADKGQQIYRRSFTWKSVDIDIKGTRSKILNKSFRSTKQIIQLAKSLQAHDKTLLNDSEFLPSTDPDIKGPVPELSMVSSIAEEKKKLIKKIKELITEFPTDTIGVIAHSNDRLDDIALTLAEVNIAAIKIKSDEADFLTQGVKLVSFHSSKGLEFDHVIVTGLQEGKLPIKPSDPGDDPDAHVATERRKLYVAMTRARLTLSLIAVTPISQFVGELDNDLYKKV